MVAMQWKVMQEWPHSTLESAFTAMKQEAFISQASFISVIDHYCNVWSLIHFLNYASFCSYSTIGWAASVSKGQQPNVDYSLRASTDVGKFFGVLSALGDVAFAYAGHNVVLEIQASLPSTPEKPSKKPMWKGVIFAYIVVALCYFPVALVGYWAFGNAVKDNVLISLNKPSWLIAAANMFVVIHVIGSYQVRNSLSL